MEADPARGRPFPCLINKIVTNNMNIYTTIFRKQIITAVMGVVLCFGIVFSGTALSAQAATQTDREARIAQLWALIAELRTQIAYDSQDEKQEQEEIPWNPPEGKSVLHDWKDVQTVYIPTSREVDSHPYQTLLVRWDKDFTFSDASRCEAEATYKKGVRSTTIVNTTEAYDHIGFYLPVTERHHDSNLESFKVECFENDNASFSSEVEVSIKEVEVEEGDTCYSDGEWYKEGTQKTTIIDEAGNATTIADAYYVCDDGEWDIKGSYPGPSPEPEPDGSGNIENITNQAKPLVKGTAVGVKAIGFSIDNGDKVYGSGDIRVNKKGKWAHRVQEKLYNGEYTLRLYIDNVEVDSEDFEITKGLKERGLFTVHIGDKLVKTIKNATEKTANKVCDAKKRRANEQSVVCEWNGKVIYSADGEGEEDEVNPDGDVEGASITLLGPTSYQTVYSKIDPERDVVSINWDIDGIPEGEVNVIIIVEAVELFSGSRSGSGAQQRAYEGQGSRKIDIGREGTLDPGKYEVRLKLQDCEPAGCNYNYNSDLEVHAESKVGYFTIEDTEAEEEIDEVTGQVLGIGVYEGGYPDGDSHSFRYHPQGEVDVEVGEVDRDSVLVLTSYEPVKWNLSGEGLGNISKIFASGYHEQEVAGSHQADVTRTSYEGGDYGEYYYAYKKASTNYTTLNEAVKEMYGKSMTSFVGAYAEDSFAVGEFSSVSDLIGSTNVLCQNSLLCSGGESSDGSVRGASISVDAELNAALTALQEVLMEMRS